MPLALTIAGALFLVAYFVLFRKAVAVLAPEDRERLFGIGSFGTNVVIVAGLLGIALLDRGWLRFAAAALLFLAALLGTLLRSQRIANESFPEAFLRPYRQSMIAFGLAAVSLLGAFGLDVLG